MNNLTFIPIVITIAMINMSNNIRDLVNDKEKGRLTLPILLGKNNILMRIFVLISKNMSQYNAKTSMKPQFINEDICPLGSKIMAQLQRGSFQSK